MLSQCRPVGRAAGARGTEPTNEPWRTRISIFRRRRRRRRPELSWHSRTMLQERPVRQPTPFPVWLEPASDRRLRLFVVRPDFRSDSLLRGSLRVWELFAEFIARPFSPFCSLVLERCGVGCSWNRVCFIARLVTDCGIATTAAPTAAPVEEPAGNHHPSVLCSASVMRLRACLSARRPPFGLTPRCSCELRVGSCESLFKFQIQLKLTLIVHSGRGRRR